MAISKVYFPCGKALALEAVVAGKVQRSLTPSINQVIHDQTSFGEPASQEIVEERYKDAALTGCLRLNQTVMRGLAPGIHVLRAA